MATDRSELLYHAVKKGALKIEQLRDDDRALLKQFMAVKLPVISQVTGEEGLPPIPQPSGAPGLIEKALGGLKQGYAVRAQTNLEKMAQARGITPQQLLQQAQQSYAKLPAPIQQLGYGAASGIVPQLTMPDYAKQQLAEAPQPQGFIQKASRTVGEMAANMPIYAAVGSLVGAPAAKAASKLPIRDSMLAADPVFRKALQFGAGSAATVGTVEAVRQAVTPDPDRSIEDLVRAIGQSTVLGGVFGAGIGALSWYITDLITSYRAIGDLNVYRKILGVGKDATHDQIDAAYKVLAKKLHPDVNPNPNAHQQFVELSKARDILKHWQKIDRVLNHPLIYRLRSAFKSDAGAAPPMAAPPVFDPSRPLPAVRQPAPIGRDPLRLPGIPMEAPATPMPRLPTGALEAKGPTPTQLDAPTLGTAAEVASKPPAPVPPAPPPPAVATPTQAKGKFTTEIAPGSGGDTYWARMEGKNAHLNIEREMPGVAGWSVVSTLAPKETFGSHLTLPEAKKLARQVLERMEVDTETWEWRLTSPLPKLEPAQTYYVQVSESRGEPKYVRTPGQPLKVAIPGTEDLELFIHPKYGESGWAVSEANTGRRFVAATSQAEAKRLAEAKLSNPALVKSMREVLAQFIQRGEVTPRYLARLAAAPSTPAAPLPLPRAEAEGKAIPRIEARLAENVAATEAVDPAFAAGQRPTIPKAQPATAPVRKADIVRFLSEKLDIPIRVGRYRQQALGIFKVKPEVVRTKLAQDLPIIAHEVGHYLDKIYSFEDSAELQNLGAKTSKPSYTTHQVKKEGVAEFVRLYLTDPAQAEAQAPNFFALFESKLDDDVKNILLTARQDIYNWTNQPAKARILGVLSIGERSSRPMTLDRLYTMVVDELRPLEKFVAEMTGGKPLSITQDPYKLASLARGWVGKAEAMLHHGVFNDAGYRLSVSLEAILRPISNRLDDFRAYIVARRVVDDLHPRGIETGIAIEDAQQVVKDLTSPAFTQAFDQLNEYQDAVLVQTLLNKGIISSKQAHDMRKLNRSYVPFYRLFDESIASVGFGKKGFADVKSPVKRIKGSGRTIIDPLESIIRNTYLFTNISERNAVGRAVAKLAEATEGAGKWVERVVTPVRGTKFELSEITEALKEAGVDVQDIDLDQIATIFRPSGLTSAKENILTVLEKGKPTFYQLHPELYRSMLVLDKESSNILVHILSYPASLLRAGAVLSPGFIARNPFRDQWTAFLFSKYGYKPGIDLARGLFHAFKKTDLYWKWQRSGGAQSTLVSLDRDYLQGTLRAMLTKTPDLNPIEWLRALSELMEQGTRLGEFAKSLAFERRQGATRQEALMLAGLASRDITVDFGRKGTKTGPFSRIIAFLNAQIQGTDKMRRAMLSDPKGFLVKALTAITLPSIALYFANRNDERYKELPQWQKDFFWIVPTKQRLWRIPKPFEAGILFGTIPERILQYIDTKDPKAFDQLAHTVKEAMLPSVLPTAFVPWVEVFSNRSIFTRLPIVPDREKGLPPEQQYGPHTSETAKVLGKITKQSPRMIEHAIGAAIGGLGKLGLNIGDLALSATGAVKTVPKPLSQDPLANVPGVGGLIARSFSQPQSIERFYARLNELETKSKRMEAGTAQMTPKEAGELTALRHVARVMSEARKDERAIHEDPNMTPEAKRDALQQINIQMIGLARRALGQSEEEVRRLLKVLDKGDSK